MRSPFPSAFTNALALFCASTFLQGAEPAVDYEQPNRFAGTVYEMASGTNKVLFTFLRTATRSNDTIHVVRDFSYPNGALAAREIAVFKGPRLISFQLDERQTGARGSSTIAGFGAADPKLLFDWVEPNGKKKTDSEDLKPDTLIGDMLPYFIVQHWKELAGGQAVNFRFIASFRLETVGFKLVKDADVTWRGKPAVRLRMEPSSVIIRQIVDPLYFTVERDGAHRVLEYAGRTTPKLRDGSKWKDLDARTIYDWP